MEKGKKVGKRSGNILKDKFKWLGEMNRAGIKGYKRIGGHFVEDPTSRTSKRQRRVFN